MRNDLSSPSSSAAVALATDEAVASVDQILISSWTASVVNSKLNDTNKCSSGPSELPLWSSPTEPQEATSSYEIKFRLLSPEDKDELRQLCSEWFPIDYPNFWYDDITSNKRFYALAATHNERIVGLIVADLKFKKQMDSDDWYVLSNKHGPNTKLTYILSLGVFKEFRRLGIASMLLETLITHLNSHTDCKAIYLHVLCTNVGAIRFYEKRNFKRRILLPKYYTINGVFQDGYCYIRYMNGGQAPFSFTEFYTKVITSFAWPFNWCHSGLNRCRFKCRNTGLAAYKACCECGVWFRSRVYEPVINRRKDVHRIS